MMTHALENHEIVLKIMTLKTMVIHALGGYLLFYLHLGGLEWVRVQRYSPVERNKSCITKVQE